MSSIVDEFEGIGFGDKRVDERSKNILHRLYEGVGNGFGASFSGDAEIKAAYRFLDNDIVNTDKILKPHYQATIERIKEYKVVILAQDTTDINMSHMENVENLGVLNDIKSPGCLLHPVLAFTVDKLCLGVIKADFLSRSAETLGKKEHHNTRKIEDKETYIWLKGYEIACEVAEQCPDTKCICVGDRESDFYELLLAASTGKAELIARAKHDRSVELPISDKEKSLLDENKRLSENNDKLHEEIKSIIKNKENSLIIKNNYELIKKNKEDIINNDKEIHKDNSAINSFKYQLSNSKIIGSIEFTIPDSHGKKARLVKQNIRAKEVTLLPSKHKKNLQTIKINSLYLEEFDTPNGEDPINWMLLTTLPIDTVEESQLIIDAYISRWGIELFFKVLKSGCKIEELRLREASRLRACVSVYMVVAWKVLYSVFIGREHPDLPCSVLFDIDEWNSVYAVIKKKAPPKKIPSIKEFMGMIATLGGYRGRKSDGPPGMKVIWIGMQAMHKLAEGWKAYREYKHLPCE